jgi:phage baseplate assembly protein W
MESSVSTTGTHSSLVEKFLTTVPGRRTAIRDVDCYISKTGDFKQIEDIDVIMKSLVNIMLTVKKTYLDDPEYGCDIIKHIFEPADDLTQSDISTEINNIVNKYEKRAKITHDISFYKNRKGFVVNLLVEFEDRKKRVSIPFDESLLKTVPK